MSDCTFTLNVSGWNEFSKSGPKSINRFLDDFSHLPHPTGLRPTVPRLGHPTEASRLLCKRPEALAAALQVLIWFIFMNIQLYFTAYVMSPLIYTGWFVFSKFVIVITILSPLLRTRERVDVSSIRYSGFHIPEAIMYWLAGTSSPVTFQVGVWTV